MPTTIYKITNQVNKKAYIGKTKSTPLNRWRGHMYDMQRPGTTVPLYNAIRRYGAENFAVAAILICANEEANEYERKAIVAFGTKRPRGYNVTDGGDGGSGFRPNQKTRAKLSAIRKGKKLSPEWKENIRRGMIGKRNALGFKQTPEAIAKISAFHKGLKCSPELKQRLRTLRLGTKLSNEHKGKIGAGLLAYHQSRKEQQLEIMLREFFRALPFSSKQRTPRV